MDNNTWQERFDALVNYDGFWGEEHPDPKNTLYMTDDKGMYSWPESQYELDPHKVKQFIERELEKARREAYEEMQSFQAEDYPMWVCCSNCYNSSINHYGESKLTKTYDSRIFSM